MVYVTEKKTVKLLSQCALCSNACNILYDLPSRGGSDAPKNPPMDPPMGRATHRNLAHGFKGRYIVRIESDFRVF